MTNVRIHFNDLLKMLEATEHSYHFEPKENDEYNLHLVLFVDGNPTDVGLLISQNHVEVTREMEL